VFVRSRHRVALFWRCDRRDTTLSGWLCRMRVVRCVRCRLCGLRLWRRVCSTRGGWCISVRCMLGCRVGTSWRMWPTWLTSPVGSRWGVSGRFRGVFRFGVFRIVRRLHDWGIRLRCIVRAGRWALFEAACFVVVVLFVDNGGCCFGGCCFGWGGVGWHCVSLVVVGGWIHPD